MKFDDDARKDPSAGDMLLGGTAMLHGIGEHTVKDRNAVRGRIFVSATVSCGVWVGGCGVWGVGWGVGCGVWGGERGGRGDDSQNSLGASLQFKIR